MIELVLMSKVFLKKSEVFFYAFVAIFPKMMLQITARRHSFFSAIFWHFHQLFVQISILKGYESFTYF